MGQQAELPMEQDNTAMPEDEGKLKVKNMPAKKKTEKKKSGPSFSELTQEQQDFLLSMAKTASDAAAKEMGKVWGFEPKKETRSTLMAVYVTGQFPLNRNSRNVSTALETKIRKRLHDVEFDVQHNGKTFKVRFKNGSK